MASAEKHWHGAVAFNGSVRPTILLSGKPGTVEGLVAAKAEAQSLRKFLGPNVLVQLHFLTENEVRALAYLPPFPN